MRKRLFIIVLQGGFALVLLVGVTATSFAARDEFYYMGDQEYVMESHYMKSMKYLAQGRLKEANEELKKALRDEYNRKGMEYAAQGRFKEAQEEFEKALRVDPFYVPAARNLQKVKDVMSRLVKKETAMSMFKGVDYTNKRQWDEAVEEFNQCIKEDRLRGNIFRVTLFIKGNMNGRFPILISH